MRQAGTRLKNTFIYRGLTKRSKGGPVWTGELRLNDKALDAPLRWRTPRRIFVNSMSDLFHENLPDEWIDRIFAVMALCPHHVFQVLTKRPERMRDYVSALGAGDWKARLGDVFKSSLASRSGYPDWPLPNVWLGTSVEDQKRADERIPHLMKTPAAVRFISAEPLLEPVDLDAWVFSRRRAISEAVHGPSLLNEDQADAIIAYPLDWVIVGGESGPGARRFDIAWARSIIQQCKAAGVACFMKQFGSNAGTLLRAGDGTWEAFPIHDRKGGNINEFPQDLRVREYP